MRVLLLGLCLMASGCASDLRLLHQLEARVLKQNGFTHTYIAPKGRQGQKALTFLETVAWESNFAVVYQEGFTAKTHMIGFLEKGQITIDAGLGVNARLQTLAHELAHVFMPEQNELTYAQSEVFAEMVTTLVCRRAGVDVRDSTVGYLADKKSGLAFARVYEREIILVADMLLPRAQ